MNVYETMLVVVSIAFICFCIAGVVITILQIVFDMKDELKDAARKVEEAVEEAKKTPEAPAVPKAPQIVNIIQETVEEDEE